MNERNQNERNQLDEKAELADAMTRMFQIRGITCSEELLVSWLHFLGDLAPRAAIDAINRFLLESTEYPTPAAVRKYAGVAQVLTDAERAKIAWPIVRGAISLHGMYQAVFFDDRLVNAALRMMGGWEAFCDTLTEDMVWREKEFVEKYCLVAKSGLGDGSPLPGIFHRVNSSNGDLKTPVVKVKIGLPVHPVAEKMKCLTSEEVGRQFLPRIVSDAS